MHSVSNLKKRGDIKMGRGHVRWFEGSGEWGKYDQDELYTGMKLSKNKQLLNNKIFIKSEKTTFFSHSFPDPTT